jgi:cardiolipin synthase A/B
MKIELLVGGAEFLERLRIDIPAAKASVRVQTLSFEGDGAGQALADLLVDCGAPDRRLLIDSYTRVILSDRFLYSPRGLADPALREEARLTRALVRTLGARGVGVRFMNPLGVLLNRIASRNHRKLVLVDDSIAYLGGINFSDHNFAWHDMMLRFEDSELGAFLAHDFDQTWDGTATRGSARFGPVELHLMDGPRSGDAFATLFGEIERAEHEIVVHSPYLSFPFVEKLAKARRRGVAVHIVTPELNNYPAVRQYLLWEAPRAGMTVWRYPGRMMHLKAMLIDGTTLIMGSANFDWLGFACCQEVVAIIRDPGTVAEFRTRVAEPDMAVSTRTTVPGSRAGGILASAKLRSAALILGFMSRG